MRILPIKEISKIREMLTVLEDKSDRDAMLFHLGVNCLLTITQLLKLKYKDVFDLYRHVKTEFIVKDRLIPITAEVRPRLIEYTERWANMEVISVRYLFSSIFFIFVSFFC
jgi:integrase